MTDRKTPDPRSDIMSSHGMLSIVSETRPGEVGTAILLTLNVFLLLLAYYLLKVAREPLILLGGGAEVKSYASAGQAVLLIFVAYAYGAIARRVNRLRLISIVTLFYVSNLVLFALLASRDVPIGVPFFIWVGIFNVTMIAAQFWAFAADIYDEERGKRMFPILGIGSSLGAVVGAEVGRHAKTLPPPLLMLIAAGLLVICVILTAAVHNREGRRTEDKTANQPLAGAASGFSLLLRDRYLLLMGAFILIYNWVNTTGEFVLDKTLLAAAAGKENPEQFVQAFKGEYFGYVNIIGLALQVLVVARVIRYLGVRAALFVMPIVSLASYTSMAIAPILSLVFAAKVAENSLDYSLQNTARQALWLVTTRDAKYKAKQVIDTFLQRAGDVMSAALVGVGTLLSLGTKGFAAANVGLVLAWFGVLVFLTREHKKRSHDHAAAAQKP
jgi:AAA family ATP:ADP antiporter